MKTKVILALIGTLPAVFQFLSGTKKSGNDAMVSVLNSSLESSKYSNTTLPQNSFEASPELLKAIVEKADNPRDSIIMVTEIVRLQNS